MLEPKDVPLPTPAKPLPAPQPLGLKPWERRGLFLFFVALGLFGLLVEFRCTCLTRRMGDLDVFLRAAWAVRIGTDVYAITDLNHHHYHYPPLFAILLTPLADAPSPGDLSWAVPYPVTVAVWYTLSVGFVAVAVHWLASALEETASDPLVRHQRPGCRRWWALRLVPVVACLPALAASLVRGQVDALLLLLLAGTIAAALRRRSGQAGLWLAGAICLKVVPVYLLLYPLWRRDARWLAGCVVGLAVGLFVVPAAAFGPARSLAYCREWWEVVVQPGLTDQGDQARAAELTDVTSTDSQSFVAIFHNTLHFDRRTRPHQASPGVRLAHWATGGLLTGLLFLAAGRRRNVGRPGTLVFLGNSVVLMLLLSPVCHLHYFCLEVPLVMGLLALAWEERAPPRFRVGLTWLLVTNALANLLPHLPGLEVLRDVGLASQAALLLWLVGVVVLWQRARLSSVSPSGQPEAARVAA